MNASRGMYIRSTDMNELSEIVGEVLEWKK